MKYNFVLFVLDAFSRYLFLLALPNKKAFYVANGLRYIFSFRNPSIFQRDGRSEG